MTWKATFEESLQRRQDGMRRMNEIVACFAELAMGTERLLDECNTFRQRCQQADQQLQEARSEVSLLRRHSLSSTANDSMTMTVTSQSDFKKIAELEAKFATMKDERSELYKAQSQNTMKLLELSDQLKQREARITDLMKEVEVGKAEQRRHDQRLEDYELLVKEKNFTIQILQDELTALQLELIKMDEEQQQKGILDGLEGTGTMLRRVSIGGVPINGASQTPQVFVEKVDHQVPSQLDRIDADVTVPIGCADSFEGMLVLANGNTIMCRNQDGTNNWSLTLTAKVCQLSAQLLPQKGIILGGRRDGIVSIINADSHRLKGQLVSPDVRELSAMAISTDREHIWTLSPNCLKYWHCDRSICLRTVQIGGEGRCLCVQGDSTVYLGLANGTIHRLSLDNMADLKTVFQHHNQPVLSLESASEKHGELIVAAYPDKAVLLQRDRPVQQFTVPTTIHRAGFFRDTHIFIAHGHHVTFYGLSGFPSERQLSFGEGEQVVKVLAEDRLLITTMAVYKLSP